MWKITNQQGQIILKASNPEFVQLLQNFCMDRIGTISSQLPLGYNATTQLAFLRVFEEFLSDRQSCNPAICFQRKLTGDLPISTACVKLIRRLTCERHGQFGNDFTSLLDGVQWKVLIRSTEWRFMLASMPSRLSVNGILFNLRKRVLTKHLIER